MTHDTRSTRTIKTAWRLLRYFGEVPLDKIDQSALDKAREALCRPDASSATFVRNVLVPLRAIMVHAYKRGWGPIPTFDVPFVERRRPTFLLPEQAELLISAAAPHLRPLLRFLFCTGARMGEALQLEWQSVDLASARAILWEGETKGGQRRIIDLFPAAVGTLQTVGHRTGRVFLTSRLRPYRSSEESGGQIKRAWATACRNADLTDISPHITRHTWATWWYALTPDPLKLMAAGGWSQLSLVQRYVKIMPSGHEEQIQVFWGLTERVQWVAKV